MTFNEHGILSKKILIEIPLRDEPNKLMNLCIIDNSFCFFPKLKIRNK